MSTPYDKIAYFNDTPLYKLSDEEIDFAIEYFADTNGWLFKLEKRRVHGDGISTVIEKRLRFY